MAQQASSHVSDDLLDAISFVESGGDPHAIGDQERRHRAYGAYQMRLPAFQDVQRIFPEEFGKIPFEALQKNADLQRLAARRYLEVGEQAYGITDLDRLIAFYNAGPSARRGELRNMNYVSKVRGRLKPKTAPLERFSR